MSARVLPDLPDPERTGGPAWMHRTGGCLSHGARLHGAFAGAQQHVINLVHRVLPRLFARLDLSGMPPIPDTQLVRLADEAAVAQGDVLLMHGFRSATFARALAYGDGVDVDPELLHVCGVLHDAGLVEAVAGEDFTVRSGATARRVAEEAGESPRVGDLLEDALLVHTTLGLSLDRDGALGTYTQAGALVDLAGLRLGALPREFVQKVLEDYPRGPFKAELLRRFNAEADALPGGRFAFARRMGFSAVVRMAPFPT